MFDVSKLEWTKTPLDCKISADRIEITSAPETDLWAKTFSDNSLNNCPVLQMKTDAEYFTFTVKASYDSDGLYDQCGMAMFWDEDNWVKSSMEREENIKHLGSVVTNDGHSDWAASDVPAEMTDMWYRLTRRESDFLLEYSADGEHFSVLRMFHVCKAAEKELGVGLYACSPRKSSFTAVFTNLDFQVKTKEEVEY